VAVYDAKEKRLVSQVTRDSGGRCWWLHFVHHVLPFGVEVFRVASNSSESEGRKWKGGRKPIIREKEKSASFPDLTGLHVLRASTSIENSRLRLNFAQDGTLSSLLVKSSFTTIAFNHSIREYLNTQGGAYLLYPTQPATTIQPLGSGLVQTGPLFSQVCATFASQVQLSCVRLYHVANCRACESFFEHLADIGPLSLKGTSEVDLISRYA
jgi:hypothetical protein